MDFLSRFLQPIPVATTGAALLTTFLALASCAVQARQDFEQSVYGVLGGTERSWIESRGDPFKGGGQTRGDLFGEAEVSWYPVRTPAGQQTLRAILVRFRFEEELTIEEALERIRAFHPRDAQFLRTVTTEAGEATDIFQSEALAAAIPTGPGSVPVLGTEPGAFFQFVSTRGGLIGVSGRPN